MDRLLIGKHADQFVGITSGKELSVVISSQWGGRCIAKLSTTKAAEDVELFVTELRESVDY